MTFTELTIALIAGAVIAGCGIACILARRDPFHVPMGVLLVVNAAVLDLVALSSRPSSAYAAPAAEAEGLLLAALALLGAAAQASLVLALVLRLRDRPAPAGRSESGTDPAHPSTADLPA